MANRYDEERGWSRRGSSPRYRSPQGHFDRYESIEDGGRHIVKEV